MSSQVTLVVTTFDRPGYLAECLASVKQQTLMDFRLVVLDNASTADYSGVLDRFRELPVNYVRNDSNIGATGNIEKALRCYSDTDYLVVFHDDDIMHPRMLEWQVDVLEGNPEIQFVSTELAVFSDGDAPRRGVWVDVSPQIEVYDDEIDLARSLLGNGRLCFGSTMYRSSVLGQLALDAPRFGIMWDRPFLLDAARLGKSALMKAPLVLSRHHPGQDTNTGPMSASNLIELMRAYRAALPARWNQADRQLYYAHASIFLIGYGYARLAPEQRTGATTFIRTCIDNKVLRIRDLGVGGWASLMRADGRRVLPTLIEAARAVKRRCLPRRRSATGEPASPSRDKKLARHVEK